MKIQEIENINPLGYGLLVEIEAVENKTKGGVILPDEVQKRQNKTNIIGKIIAKGTAAFSEDYWGEINIGDDIIFEQHAGQEFEYQNKKVRLIKDEQVRALVQVAS